MKNILKLLILLAFAQHTYAQDEMLIDLDFGDDGYSYFNYSNSDHPHAVSCDVDGNIFIATSRFFPGSLLLVKLNSQGIADSTFSDDGIFVFSPDTLLQVNFVESVVLPNGKIIVAATVYQGEWGASQPYLVVIRVNQDGTLDESFGNSGVSQLERSFMLVSDMLIVENEIVYISCLHFSNETGRARSEIYTVNESGILEEFAAEVISSVNPESFLVIGRIEYWNNELLCLEMGGLLFKIGADGQLISNFGENGILDLPSDGPFRDIIRIESGQVLVLEAGLPSKLRRINQNGTLDESFGTNGELVLSNTEGCRRYHRLHAHPSGNIILAGYSKIYCDSSNFIQTHLAQLNVEGEPVPMMCDDGTIDFSLDSYGVGVFTIQPNGKIIYCVSRLGTEETRYDIQTIRIDPTAIMAGAAIHSSHVNSMSISPNPANNITHVNLELQYDTPPPLPGYLVLFDTRGQAVLRKKLFINGCPNTLIELEVDQLPSGCYTVYWIGENAWVGSVKLIKQ